MPAASRASALLLALALACAGARPPGASNGAAPRAAAAARALARFAEALDRGRWDDAWALLSERWRGRLTPALLAGDYAAAEPVARRAAERVRALLAAGAVPALRDGRAVLPIGEGKAAVLLEERGDWRVDSLE